MFLKDLMHVKLPVFICTDLHTVQFCFITYFQLFAAKMDILSANKE